jgi:hypothetical protein
MFLWLLLACSPRDPSSTRLLPDGGVDLLLTQPSPAIDDLQGVFWYAEERRGVEV